jgi:hypothetical protein
VHQCEPIGRFEARLIMLLAELFKTGQIWRCPSPTVCCTQKAEGMCMPCTFVLNLVTPGDIVFGWSSVLRKHIPPMCVRVCVCVCVSFTICPSVQV